MAAPVEGNGVGVELKEPVESVSMMAFLEMLQDHWLGSFLLNLLGYALIILPAALLIRRWKNDPLVKAGNWHECVAMAVIIAPL
jgi:hypothetical protein